MNKDKIDEAPEVKETLKELESIVSSIDELLLASGDMTAEERRLMDSMNTLLQVTKKPGGVSKNQQVSRIIY